MCRLLAHVSARPATLAEILGEANTQRFVAMSRLHDDGWGSMWVTEPGLPVARERFAVAGYSDERLDTLLRTSRARARAIHLRLATASLAVEEPNTHPFLGDHVGFAHNGSIVPTAALTALVAPDLLATVTGTTDSERYFAIVRDGLRDGLSAGSAVGRAISVIREHYPLASLNSLLLSPTELVVSCSSEGSLAPYDDFRAMGDRLPLDHEHAYFRMSYRIDDAGDFVVASAGLDVDGWTTLPQDSVTVVDLETRAVDTLELALAAR